MGCAPVLSSVRQAVGGEGVSLVDCPKCWGPLDVVFARDESEGDPGEVMDAYCGFCGWEGVDAEFGDAVVGP